MSAATWGGVFSPRRRVYLALVACALIAAAAYGVWTRRAAMAILNDAARLHEIRALVRGGQLSAGREAVARWQREAPTNDFATLAGGWLALAEKDREGVGKALTASQGAPELERRALEACQAAAWGDAAQAEALLVRLLDSTKSPQPEACQALASQALKTYKLALASLCLKRWMVDDPNDATPYVWMTEIDDRTEAGAAAAVEHLREALKRDPNHGEARRQLAEALRASNQADQALPLFNALIAENSENVPALLGRGLLFFSQGKLESAALDFDAVLKLDPKNLVALRERAAIDLAENDPAAAQEPRRQSLGAGSRLADAEDDPAAAKELRRESLGAGSRLADAEGDPAAALSAIERAGTQGGDRAERGPAAALKRLDTLLSIDAYDADAHYRRGAALDRLGRGAEAVASRNRAAELREDHKVLDRIQKALNRAPNDPNLRCQIAAWMFAHGQPAQGLRWAGTVLATDPEHADANRMMAEYYEAHGDPGRANFHRVYAAHKDAN